MLNIGSKKEVKILLNIAPMIGRNKNRITYTNPIYSTFQCINLRRVLVSNIISRARVSPPRNPEIPRIIRSIMENIFFMPMYACPTLRVTRAELNVRHDRLCVFPRRVHALVRLHCFIFLSLIGNSSDDPNYSLNWKSDYIGNSCECS